MQGDWRDDDIALLKRLWAQGETAARIAEKLGGISRSAVLGKIFRLRLGPGAGKEPGRAAAKAGERQRPARRRGVEPPPVPAAKGRYRKPLFDLTNRCCRWTPDQIKQFQDYWDTEFSGDLARRRRAKFVPGDTAVKVHQTK